MKTAINISSHVQVYQNELIISAIRAQGPGGQNVNKSSTAIQLQFNIHGSSLPESVKIALQKSSDRRINANGMITIKAQRYRSQDKNRDDAISRLQAIIEKVMHKKKYRVATKPSKTSIQKRLDGKKSSGVKKQLRKKPEY